MRDLIRMTVILTLIICLPFNSVAIIDSSSQVEVEIIVDATSKSVQPGQEAIFYWMVYNNCTLLSIDFRVDSHGNKTVFSQSRFTLGPRENMLVKQYCPTLINDTNGTQFSYIVTWSGTIKTLTMTYSVSFVTQTLDVMVIDETDLDQINEDDPNYFINQNSIYELIIVGSVILIVIIVLTFWKFFLKRKWIRVPPPPDF